MSRHPRPVLWLHAVLVVGAWPAVLWAAPTPTDKAAAQALFDEAIKLLATKRFDQACPKLEESERLEDAMGTRFQLAQCYEGLGRTASAWAAFLELADIARAANQPRREHAARARAALLEPKVSRLAIDVTAPAAVEVRRDGSILGSAQWAVAIPVDSGTHHVSATAPGRVAWESDVTIQDDGRTVRLTVPVLNEEAAPALPTPPPPVPPPVPPVVAPALPAPLPEALPAETAPPQRSGRAQRVAGITLLCAGVAGVAAGVAVGVAARSQYESAGAECSAAGCDAPGKQTTDAARRLGNVATGVFIGGAALGAGGLALWLTAPSVAAPACSPGSSCASARLRVAPGWLFFEGPF